MLKTWSLAHRIVNNQVNLHAQNLILSTQNCYRVHNDSFCALRTWSFVLRIVRTCVNKPFCMLKTLFCTQPVILHVQNMIFLCTKLNVHATSHIAYLKQTLNVHATTILHVKNIFCVQNCSTHTHTSHFAHFKRTCFGYKIIKVHATCHSASSKQDILCIELLTSNSMCSKHHLL